MATIKFTLSNKVRQITEDSEILLRLSICREKTYRLHSGLYVKPGNWDAPKSKINYRIKPKHLSIFLNDA